MGWGGGGGCWRINLNFTVVPLCRHRCVESSVQSGWMRSLFFVFLSLFCSVLLSRIEDEERRLCYYACAKYKRFNVLSQFTLSEYINIMKTSLFTPVF